MVTSPCFYLITETFRFSIRRFQVVSERHAMNGGPGPARQVFQRLAHGSEGNTEKRLFSFFQFEE